MANSCDVIIAGGGVVGSSIAYNLMADGFTGRVVIFERDPVYEHASTPRSAGGIRQVFSTEVNVRMSQYGLEVFQRFEEDMAVGGEAARIDFKRRGYLFLLNDRMLAAMGNQLTLLRRLGVRVEVLTPQETKSLIPELRVDDLAASVYSPDDGYMDPYSVMQAYIRKAKSLGVEYVRGQVAALMRDEQGRMAGVRLESGEVWRAPVVVNACGAWSGDLSRTIGVDLPVAPLPQQVFCVDPGEPIQTPLPLTVDISGVYFRHEGRKVIAGRGEVGAFRYDLGWQRATFEQKIWPFLAERCPNFERLKLERGWAGLYDYNPIDHNGIIGGYTDIPGYYVATGFSGHGLQHAPAAGKAVSELIRLGRLETLDVSALSPERFRVGQLVVEDAII
ncbi:MAG: FAD-binding oxidoreductase [Alicyclobacillus macrosporangiidus]|uniref:NAD(P)/FAD-dependent oxidoreductase n=1 Tax=Alicyclobacillus macrosporangiidus TaxID=392015 RepID=UPI0026EFE55B|nr:FAD-binding oxidoreductase [Alicyclobacillus macrosporangiidus]MCL6597714.1 FAD-binding oxidoreductase [Alicyclobacillus macrosporangiidus]